MRSVALFIVSYTIMFLVLRGGRKVEAEELFTTIGDLDGKCSQDGEKLCMRYMTDQSKKKFLSCTCNNVVMLHNKYKHDCECKSHCTPK
ncbi:PREDICTED: putative defensin-like protein 230 [Camelina sativa]|uniref:Defensin-like protein 230 n=1 Tax=Camelina sativa TaxID=90675 RepID=A0ABM1QIL2_CAMSA|nr:PREDICTED: putative defensin-like protein 230 [Camelina sativa]